MSDNPLSKYYRTPSVYIKLPSHGKYWPDGSLDLPPNGEIPVLPMNGKDDIALRNADGLMNGTTTVDIIQSCCPNIKDAWKMPMIDLDSVLIAIRQASYGQTMSFTSKCSKCGEFHDYEIDLGLVRDTIKLPNYEESLMVNDLMIVAKPATYKLNNEVNQEKFDQQRALRAIQDAGLTDEQRIEKFKEAVSELTAKAVGRLASFIDYIITPDGTKVVDEHFIQEFISNADQKTFNIVKDFITKMNGSYGIEPILTKCDKCGNEEKRTFQFDPSNFFG